MYTCTDKLILQLHDHKLIIEYTGIVQLVKQINYKLVLVLNHYFYTETKLIHVHVHVVNHTVLYGARLHGHESVS